MTIFPWLLGAGAMLLHLPLPLHHLYHPSALVLSMAIRLPHRMCTRHGSRRTERTVRDTTLRNTRHHNHSGTPRNNSNSNSSNNNNSNSTHIP